MKTLKEQIEKAYNPFGGIYIFNKAKLRTLLDEAFKEKAEKCAKNIKMKQNSNKDPLVIHQFIPDRKSILTSPDPETGLEIKQKKICDGCNVRDPWEHRCHGKGCDCDELTCQVQQGKLTMEEAFKIANQQI